MGRDVGCLVMALLLALFLLIALDGCGKRSAEEKARIEKLEQEVKELRGKGTP